MDPDAPALPGAVAVRVPVLVPAAPEPPGAGVERGGTTLRGADRHQAALVGRPGPARPGMGLAVAC
jgi:hypothetical protein